MTLNPEYILQVFNLTKSFSGIKALEGVHLNVRRGEVHAIMGENGAGKSTFMKILMGLLQADAGQVFFEGEELRHSSVHEALKRGISMIHQEILMVPELTVAQNIFLGRENALWLKDHVNDQEAATLLARLGMKLNPRTKMKYLSVAEMQMVEIAKAISNNAKVIIMDEPTSAISDKEVDALFKIIRDLKAQGVAILYISHKMNEIYEITDTITVLRDGKYIGTKSTKDIDNKSLIAMMVGREIESLFPPALASKGEVLLEVKNLSSQGKFEDISFEVRAGEVLGLAGLMGAGRTEIARAIFGLDAFDRGEVWLKSQKVTIKSPQEAIKVGIGYVSEDRKGLGFIPGLSVKQNISLSSLRRHSKRGLLQSKSEEEIASRTISELKIKASSMEQKVRYLSGGNQQKVVIGKVLQASPEVVILDEPTRGIDIGAKSEIYKLIRELTTRGMAVVMISSELPEILGMSDRILVLSQGKQTALLPKEEASQETIMRYAMPE